MKERFTTSPEEAKAMRQMEDVPYRKTPWGYRAMLCMAETLLCCHIVHLSINAYQDPSHIDIFSPGLGGFVLQLNLFVILPSLICSALPKGIYVARILLPLLAVLNIAAAGSMATIWAEQLRIAYLTVPPFLFIAADCALRGWQSWKYGHCFYVVTFVDLARQVQEKKPGAVSAINTQFILLGLLFAATIGWFMSL